MASELPAAMAATVTVRIGGRDLTMGPLTIGGLADFDLWHRMEPLRNLEAILPYAVDAAHRRALTDEAFRDYRAGRYAIDTAEGAGLGGRLEAWAKLIFLMIRPHTPDVTERWILDNLRRDDLAGIKTQIAILNGDASSPTTPAPVATTA